MKLSIKKLTILAGLLAAFGVSSTQAQWALIDDFEGYDEGTFTQEDGNLPYPIASNGGRGYVDIFSGIEGTGGEKAAWFWYGIVDANAGDVWHQIPLPDPIEPGETATIYFRVWISAVDLNWHFMISKVAAGDEPDNTALWGNQASVMRYNTSEPLMLDVHSGGYIPSNPIWAPEPGNWYEFWLVLNNSYDENDEQSDPLVGGYKIYRRDPGETGDPTVMEFGGDTVVEDLIFRNKAMTSLKTIVLIQNGQDAGNTWLLDDIYIAPGPDLSTPGEDPPPPTEWCDIEKVGSDVNTGDFLGWLYVGDLTGAGWVYSYDLGSFVYISACPDDSGAWVYVLN